MKAPLALRILVGARPPMFLKGCCFVRAITGSEYCLLEERIRPPELGSLSRAQLSKGNAIDSKHQEDFYNPFILTQIESHARKDFHLDDTIIICMFKTCFFITIQHLHCFKVRPPSPAEKKVKTLDRNRWAPMYMQCTHTTHTCSLLPDDRR